MIFNIDYIMWYGLYIIIYYKSRVAKTRTRAKTHQQSLHYDIGVLLGSPRVFCHYGVQLEHQGAPYSTFGYRYKNNNTD